MRCSFHTNTSFALSTLVKGEEDALNFGHLIELIGERKGKGGKKAGFSCTSVRILFFEKVKRLARKFEKITP